MHGVKDQMNLVRAFLDLLEKHPEFRAIARLVLVGDGPLRLEATSALEKAGILDLAWLPGERKDVPDILITRIGYFRAALYGRRDLRLHLRCHGDGPSGGRNRRRR